MIRRVRSGTDEQAEPSKTNGIHDAADAAALAAAPTEKASGRARLARTTITKNY